MRYTTRKHRQLLATGLVRCRHCAKDKTPDEFYGTDPAKFSWCKQCQKENATEWREARPKSAKALQTVWDMNRGKLVGIGRGNHPNSIKNLRKGSEQAA